MRKAQTNLIKITIRTPKLVKVSKLTKDKNNNKKIKLMKNRTRNFCKESTFRSKVSITSIKR
jgi:hypothetical protein